MDNYVAPSMNDDRQLQQTRIKPRQSALSVAPKVLKQTAQGLVLIRTQAILLASLS